MKNNHDPYLTTVKRSLDEDRIKERKKQLKYQPKKQQLKKGFFSQNFELRSLINLPSGLQEVVLFGFFIFIPYVVGFLSIFIIQLNMGSFQGGGVGEFLFLWTIGYELCASFILMTLIYQSFTYQEIR